MGPSIGRKGDTRPEDLTHRFLSVVLGARVGDAMGAPTEGMDPGQIEERFGWVSEFSGDGTDDSLMATMLAQALIATGGRAGGDDWAAQWVAHAGTIKGMRNKFFISVLHSMEKLRYGWSPSRVGAGNMPSSSSAMAIWPVGLVNCGRPADAAAQAYALASLIHGGDVDFCQDGAAAVAAAVAAGLRPGLSVDQAAAMALDVLRPISGALMRSLIGGALDLAQASENYETFRADYHARFRQTIVCDSRETVPAAFGIALLARGDLVRAVEYAANFGRDADTIATMTGALCGALLGTGPLPPHWLDSLGPAAVESATGMARQLVDVARSKASHYLDGLASVPGMATGPGPGGGADADDNDNDNDNDNDDDDDGVVGVGGDDDGDGT